MTTNPSDLPSRVQQTLSACPQFRILITGNTGIGKSSLVSKVFGVGLKELDIAHDRAGRAEIEHGFTSPTNPRFILHDSQGYEPGNIHQWAVAEDFIKSRAKHEHPQERVHAIWLCVETPRTGGRLLQVGDEKLIELVSKMGLPLLVIFTKYDLLITEKLKELPIAQTYLERLKMATEQAKDDFQERVRRLPKNLAGTIEYIPVSTNEKIFGNCLDSFQTLTAVTRRMLHDIEGELYVTWAAAQQVNALQKIETSISEGFKKYWRDLGTNVVFEGFVMWDCVSRIHRDVLEIWNFNDPNGLLTGNEFCTQMVKLTQPILTEGSREGNAQGQSKFLGELSNAVTVAGQITTVFGQALGAAGIAAVTIKFFPVTSLYLASYITSLIIVFQTLFIQTLSQEPPRPLTKDLVDSAWQTYVDNDSKRILDLVKKATNSGMIENPEQKIAQIFKELFPNEPDHHSPVVREGKRPEPDVGSTKDMGRRMNSMPEKLNMDHTPLRNPSTFTSSSEEVSVKKKKGFFYRLFKK